MDDKLRRRPHFYVIDDVVLVEKLLCFLIPETAAPFVVELYSRSDNLGNLEDSE